MNKIQVTARFTPQGKIIPMEFISEEIPVAVHDVGRQWRNEEGYHILVMDQNTNTYHLLFKPSQVSWHLVRDISSPSVPT